MGVIIMTKEEIVVLAKEIIVAQSCCPELKAATQNWLDALGTDSEKSAAENLIAELKVDVMTVDQVIAAMEIDAVIAHLGNELAGIIKAHAMEQKKNGETECDCPACAAGWKILHNKEIIL